MQIISIITTRSKTAPSTSCSVTLTCEMRSWVVTVAIRKPPASTKGMETCPHFCGSEQLDCCYLQRADTTARMTGWISEKSFPTASSLTVAGKKAADISFDKHHLIHLSNYWITKQSEKCEQLHCKLTDLLWVESRLFVNLRLRWELGLSQCLLNLELTRNSCSLPNPLVESLGG